jgi:hypothetical protein
MKRYLLVGLVAAALATASVLLGYAYVSAGSGSPSEPVTASQGKAAPNTFPQPDTRSPDWRPISDDLGIWITRSETFGLRGRLYVRLRDSWWPVAIDGAADIHGAVPVR